MDALKMTLREDSYTRQVELAFSDCDRFQRARVSTLLRYAANFAGYDYDARGLTHDVLYQRREMFLLSRIALAVHRCPRVRDVLDVTTWEDGVKGAHMRRVYEMADQTGAVCVSVKSDWILVDPVTRKILRPGQFTAKELGRCPKEIDCPEPRRIVLPKEGTEDLGVRRVVWSDLDGNGHVYSANYGDYVWDALPPDLQDRTPRSFQIEYSREATLGQELRLAGVREGGTYRMAARGPGGVCFAASCEF